MKMQKTKTRTYIAIDLKSFYASVECRERDLDALTTNLVVADASRTSKTICLAVSPSLKAYGIPGRARLFEAEQRVKEVNAARLREAVRLGCAVKAEPADGCGPYTFRATSVHSTELAADPSLGLDFIIAVPQMRKYMEISSKIYGIYLRYIAPEDIHVYSIDEVFLDVTAYLGAYNMTPRELAMKMILDVLQETGITATAGIGTNLYLCKVAMDIEAKHISADENGVRIAELDEISYRRRLWTHEPLTDFWRVGRGLAKKLQAAGLTTMGDIARCSLGRADEFYNEDLLYRMFGINAELLIDHAWGWEPCPISEIKKYKPKNNSLGSGQALACPHPAKTARLITHEMIDSLALELLEKELVTDQVTLTLGYDRENLTDPERRKLYKGPVTTDHYGRRVPAHAHGSVSLPEATNSARQLTEQTLALFDRIVNPSLLIRRITLSAGRLLPEAEAARKTAYEQLDLFTDYQALEKEKKQQARTAEREKHAQLAMLEVQKRFGKNAMIKGMNLEEGATGLQRNNQVGGHRA